MINESLLALTSFALVSSITPGPNNIMLMSSGTNFGFRKTIPHMLGVCLGFVLMVSVVGLGLTQVFSHYPIVHKVLKYICVAYLIYLSYKIATSSPASAGDKTKTRPFTFLQAALFQWVNPKAITMALAAISLFAPSNTFADVFKVAIIFGLVNLPSVSVWVVLGQQIRRALDNHRRLKIFNFMMAGLLLSSLGFILG